MRQLHTSWEEIHCYAVAEAAFFELSVFTLGRNLYRNNSKNYCDVGQKKAIPYKIAFYIVGPPHINLGAGWRCAQEKLNGSVGKIKIGRRKI